MPFARNDSTGPLRQDTCSVSVWPRRRQVKSLVFFFFLLGPPSRNFLRFWEGQAAWANFAEARRKRCQIDPLEREGRECISTPKHQEETEMELRVEMAGDAARQRKSPGSLKFTISEDAATDTHHRCAISKTNPKPLPWATPEPNSGPLEDSPPSSWAPRLRIRAARGPGPQARGVGLPGRPGAPPWFI